ncbi:MAG: hypothetical protein A3F47_01800 [Candidatus Staskawiczbacteria bacterium RIFCSPHIGHO2_12_FULL_38_11]|uniref:Uncharacterized protein n=1 Tax=Candidatus Staskawiczbacteria bacterium RIFCSPHIGHO2_12_FULL_38_11 TaxID=1802209 RepID=A0A1G2I3X3_9BACT|nr:MAG: hypothetical protein A3F47_01800 [Candidatus Staskawiczbacteria bacterium RIFCSPHIGHO2_12_FULL_38_11]
MNRIILALVCFAILFSVVDGIVVAQNKNGSKGDSKKVQVTTEQSLKDALVQLKLFQIRLDGDLKILEMDFERAQKRRKEKLDEAKEAISKWKHNDSWMIKLKQKKLALERQEESFKKEKERRLSDIEFFKGRSVIQISTIEKQLKILEKGGATLPSPIKKSK